MLSQTPNIHENFGIRLVEDRLCTDDEYTKWEQAYKDNIAASMVNETTVYSFNPFLANGPTCRMTKQQVLSPCL
jgi:hypothetical protein